MPCDVVSSAELSVTLAKSKGDALSEEIANSKGDALSAVIAESKGVMFKSSKLNILEAIS